MFTTPHTPNANYEGAAFGISAGPETLATAATFLHVHLMRQWSSSLLTLVAYNKAGTETQLYPSGTSTDVYVLRLIGPNFWQAFVGTSVAGAWPARTALTMAGSVAPFPASTLSTGLLTSTATQIWFYFNVVSNNTAGAADGLLKQLKIEQR
jgi:hypothetical protein